LDSHCEDGEECKGGVCKPRACTVGEECKEGEKCEDGKCVPITCAGDVECEAPLVCQGGRCAFVCAEESDCTDGDMCQGNRCVARPCTANVECTGGLVCKDGKCVRDCSTDAECKEGYVCDEGRCRVNFICKNDYDCGYPGNPTYCSHGQCVRPCINNTVCPPGSECIEGYCARTRLPCPPGTFLHRGQCIKAKCDPDKLGDRCQNGLQQLGCTQDSQCGPGSICYRGHCLKTHIRCNPLQYEKLGCRNLFTTYAKTKPDKTYEPFVMFHDEADKNSCLEMCKKHPECGMAWTDANTNACVIWSLQANQSRTGHGTGETHILTRNTGQIP
jgi:hypothetical protein